MSNPQRSIPRALPPTIWRNRLAHRIANWALNKIATKDYRDTIGALIRVGIYETYGAGATRGTFDRLTGEKKS